MKKRCNFFVFLTFQGSKQFKITDVGEQMYKVMSGVFCASTLVLGVLYFNKVAPIQEKIISRTGVSDFKTENEKLSRELLKLKDKYQSLLSRPKDQVFAQAETNPQEMLDSGLSLVEMTSLEMELRDLMKKRIVQSIEARHSRLLDKLNLSPSEREALVAIYRERMMGRMKFGMQMREAGTDEEKAALKLEQEKEREGNELALQAQLGNQYDVYLDYQEKRNDYESLDSVNRRLKDNKLSEEQTEKMATLMNDLTKTYSSLEDVDGRQVYELNAEDKKTYIADMTERNQQLIDTAANDLSVEQLASLKNQLDNDLKRMQHSSGGRKWGGRGPR